MGCIWTVSRDSANRSRGQAGIRTPPALGNMGQKLSELRGFMLTMEDEEASCEQVGDQDGSSRKSSESENGNVAQDQHFEAIYSSRNDPSSSSDEVNGNSSHACTALEPQCTCVQTRPRNSRKREEASGSLKRVRAASLTNVKKVRPKRSKETNNGAKKRQHWGLRLNCARLKADADLPDAARDGCVCTGYRRTAESPSPTSPSSTSSHDGCACSAHRRIEAPPPAIDLARFNPDDFPIEDCDERARLERAREMAEGVEPPPGFTPGLPALPELNLDSLAVFFQTRLGLQAGMALSALSHMETLPAFQRMHSQADFIHCLVPDLLEITSCSFYWGKMDRYEAERLLEGRPEGTFLLRDSAQEEHLFSVSFRKYGRSLHARIEQWNHRFSFDSHDPGVFSSPTVVGLIEHYKDPSFCMFFEPMLTIPLHRTFTFPLQHLCRAAICSTTNYDAINRLPLPRPLKAYLREYHYKQRVRVRNLDSDL